MLYPSEGLLQVNTSVKKTRHKGKKIRARLDTTIKVSMRYIPVDISSVLVAIERRVAGAMTKIYFMKQFNQTAVSAETIMPRMLCHVSSYVHRQRVK